MQTTATVHWNKGNVSEKHNERDKDLCENESHIDLYNVHGDSYHETWYASTLTDKYAEIFQDAIDAYNAKQKRADRKIDIESYMQSVVNDTRGKKQTKNVNGKRVVDENAKREGKQLSYEITVKVGNTYRRHDINGRTIYDENNHHIRDEELPRDLQRTILKRYCDTFQDENPNFRVVNINFHADEGFENAKGVWEYSEMHPHIEFIPIAHGFRQGMSVQNSMNKAMKEMGFNTPDCYELWSKKEQERLEKIMQEEYEKYCNDNHDFAKSQGDSLNIYHPVADGQRRGDLTKEQFAKEQELDEAIHEVEHLRHVVDNGFAKTKEKQQQLDEQIAQQKAATEAAEKAKEANERELAATRRINAELQQKVDEAETEREAYHDAKVIYENATEQVEENNLSLEEWARKKSYVCPVGEFRNVKTKTGDIVRKMIPVKDENGHTKMQTINVLEDYQRDMNNRVHRGYEFSDIEQQKIDKANGYDFQ